ncbi:hypothetical protein WICMUC_002530 [Wickerhamomyces mucosus]|uniref:Uncharacterized protein n=1 Tax=Wickerhamomyces mucosus TaxID=1378264 RepID=A0A9P8TDQ7_9ASCO|nr:hypothetical protein WICMUC_002530 [Wickerhamomyces mucosus]
MIQLLQASPKKLFNFNQILKPKKSSSSFSSHISFEKPQQQGLLIGSPASGKNTILNHINQLDFPFDIISLSNDVAIENYKNFMFDTSFIIFVFDCTMTSDLYFQYVNHILDVLITNYHSIDSQELKILILLNKLDLAGPETSTRVIENHLKLSRYSHVNYLALPCNGVLNYGVSEGVNWLLI